MSGYFGNLQRANRKNGGMRMQNVFVKCPVIENERYLLRLVEESDAKDLLKVYSDKKALPFSIVIIVTEPISICRQRKRWCRIFSFG